MTRRIDNPDTDADIEVRRYLSGSDRAPFVMVAGAGSGKTTSLIKALDHIGKTYGMELRRRNQQVACITYTEVAVGEIGGDVGNIPLFHVSTIHSFLWALVKSFQKDIATWVRQRIETKLLELRETRENFGPRVQQKTRDKNARDIARYQNDLAAIAHVTRFTYESGSDYPEGILGHDDIINMVPQLIKERPLLASIVANKYPFFFVDESQDTFPQVVDALKAVAERMAGKIVLGFFGDSMQQIYMTGVGAIPVDAGWKKITKPENFRCPTTVLSVINNIRAGGDGLEQTRGRQQSVAGVLHPVAGTAKLFVLPADEHRSRNLDRVRAWLAQVYSDAHWTNNSPEADVRILVLVHRMAAARLGFPELYTAFNDHAPESFANGFREGTAWAIKPFLDVLLPLSAAFEHNRQFELMTLLRTHCPKLNADSVKGVVKSADLLTSLKQNVRDLAGLTSKSGNASTLDVLRFADSVHLIRLDERLKAYLDLVSSEDSQTVADSSSGGSEEEGGEDAEKEVNSMSAYFACPAKQLWGYQAYIGDESPYSTQQGIKGAEFERVLVVIDDEEGRHFQFSYDKLLGLKEPSKTDMDNQRQGKETILDRTRRLFYVCCSRAKKDLAVVLYSQDVQSAAARLRQEGIFEPTDICTLDDIT